MEYHIIPAQKEGKGITIPLLKITNISYGTIWEI